ncbi:MAG: AI-2E family transporter [Lachnospiraceae bacterium]|nr:AI-2E family transporter [Lachnospiraceae bacterium]
MDSKHVDRENSSGKSPFGDNSPFRDHTFLKYVLIILTALLIFRYFGEILDGAGLILQVISPLLLGCVLAFILNLVMVQVERGYTFLIRRFCKTEKPLKFRRIIGIVGSLLLILLFLIFLVGMVVPRIVEVFSSTAQALPSLFNALKDFAIKNQHLFPQASEYIISLNIDWQNLFQRVMSFAGSGISSVFGNAFSFIGMLTGTLSNLLFALIFAIYILVGKERLAGQINRVLAFLLKPRMQKELREILGVFNRSFSSFISGQCIEALILGALCILGMSLLRLPYASVIGTLVGATALIPVLGAYIGGGIGFILIFTVSPLQALYFVIFLVILQQLEGNLIYPRVVGASIGLPGIWVFAAVTVGGGLAGISGMLVGVPLTAGVYQLLKKYIR